MSCCFQKNANKIFLRRRHVKKNRRVIPKKVLQKNYRSTGVLSLLLLLFQIVKNSLRRTIPQLLVEVFWTSVQTLACT